MAEVWDMLNEEFGQVLENVSNLVRSLLPFKISKYAKTEPQQFIELARIQKMSGKMTRGTLEFLCYNVCIENLKIQAKLISDKTSNLFYLFKPPKRRKRVT